MAALWKKAVMSWWGMILLFTLAASVSYGAYEFKMTFWRCYDVIYCGPTSGRYTECKWDFEAGFREIRIRRERAQLMQRMEEKEYQREDHIRAMRFRPEVRERMIRESRERFGPD